MAGKTLTEVVGAVGGGVHLAPNLTFFTDRFQGGDIWQLAFNIDTTGALTEILGLSGKFIVSLVELTNIIANDLRKIKLTIDGVVIWNEIGITVNAILEPLIAPVRADHVHEAILVNSSFSLEVETATDTTVGVAFIVRPIL